MRYCPYILAALLAAVATAAAQSSFSAPKRIILMVADGSGFNTFRAASYYEYGATGLEPYDDFAVQLACSTYPLHAGTTPGSGGKLGAYDPVAMWSNFLYARSNLTDSAAAATALASGSKTYRAAINWTDFGVPVIPIVRHAKSTGKSAGIVTSVQISHATPAAFAAHNISRSDYVALATEMFTNGLLDVLMGCGHPWYDNNGAPKSAGYDYTYVGGATLWNSLVAGTAGGDVPWSFIDAPAQFAQLAAGAASYLRVCGIARAAGTLQEERGGSTLAAPYAVPLNTNVPSLATMTLAALRVLEQNSGGFFLVVEGGAVDWAAAANRPGRLIEEQAAFNLAVQSVTNWINVRSAWSNTLVIVTCDHETGMVWGPSSGAGQPNPWDPIVNLGPGVMPGLKFNSTDHSNTLVPLYAHGAGADLLATYGERIDSVYGPYADNTDVFKALRYLLLGDPATPSDFEGRHKDNLAVFWRAQGNWYVLGAAGLIQVAHWGVGQTPVPADYDGDGLSDYAAFRPSTATWTIFQSGLASTRQQAFGKVNGIPVAADYDGDGRADLATYERATATWRILFSASGLAHTQNWGWATTIPVPADYDGDGDEDLGVYDPAHGNWYIASLSRGVLALGTNWGWSAAVPVPADYDGDGSAELGVYDPAAGNWYIRDLAGPVLLAGANWGWSAAVPAPMDFDGDGAVELAVHWRGGGTWYIRKPAGTVLAAGANWGWSDTEPVTPQYQVLRAFGMLP